MKVRRSGRVRSVAGQVDPDRETVHGPGPDGERVAVVAGPRVRVPHLHPGLYPGTPNNPVLEGVRMWKLNKKWQIGSGKILMDFLAITTTVIAIYRYFSKQFFA